MEQSLVAMSFSHVLLESYSLVAPVPAARNAPDNVHRLRYMSRDPRQTCAWQAFFRGQGVHP